MRRFPRAALLVLGALPGCESGLTSDAQPLVSVLKQDATCFALMTPDSPVDPVLGVAATCSYRAEPIWLAGVDFIQVVVDYGPDVAFAGTTVAPRPSVELTLDSVASDTPIEISDEYRIGARAFFIATFHAPSESSSNVRITAGVNAGFSRIVPVVFETRPPPIALSLVECSSGSTCQLEGAVGNANIHVAIPGTVPQTVAIRTTLGGAPQPEPLPPLVTQIGQGRTEATAAIPVPAAPDGTEWAITAQLPDAAPVRVEAIIRAPALTSFLTCQPNCTLGPDEPVGLEILAPAEIRPLQAFVDTRLDGVPQLVGAPVTLVPRNDGFAVGLVGLRTPLTPGSWQVDVTVAGYPAEAIVTTVQ